MAEFGDLTELDVTDGDTDEYDIFDEPNLIELDGEIYEIIDSLSYEGETYFAITPYLEDDEDGEDEVEFAILKETEPEDGEDVEDDEIILASLDDDELTDKVAELFYANFEEMFDEDGD